MNELIPLRTDDAVLAFGLYNAGVPEWRAPTNTFDEPILRRLGFTGSGCTLWEAARNAWSRKARGRVEYWFERTPEISHFLKVYEEIKALLAPESPPMDGGEYLRSVMSANAQETMDEREALFRIAVITLKCRINFMTRWEQIVPELSIPLGGEVTTAGTTTTYPGFKRVPLNSTPEQLAKLGL